MGCRFSLKSADCLLSDELDRHAPCLIRCEGMFGEASIERLAQVAGQQVAAFDASETPFQTPGADRNDPSRRWYHDGRYRGCELPVAEGLARVRNQDSRGRYYQLLAPLSRFPSWLSTPGVPEYLGIVSNSFLLVGGASTGAPLHYDPYDVYLFVLSGRKRVWLWSPTALKEFAIRPIHSYLCTTSRRNWEPPERYLSHFRPADAVVEVEGSQCLYLPNGWYHFVVNEGVTIALSTTRKPAWWHRCYWRNLRVGFSRFVLRRIFVSRQAAAHYHTLVDPSE